MAGLFGILNLGQRSLQAQEMGVQVAGHNIANVSNTAYSRQRIRVEASQPVEITSNIVGTGIEVSAVEQLRNQFLDTQIQKETSITGFLESRQFALEYAQSDLGQVIDRMSTGAEGTAASTGVGGQHGIAENLSAFFAALQSLSNDPAAATDRQNLIDKATDLASSFQQTDGRLTNLRSALNSSVSDQVSEANRLVADIAKLNDSVANAELSASSTANDLRDSREEKIEALAKLVDVETSSGNNGAVNISVSGAILVSGRNVQDTMETYDAGGGQVLVRTKTGATPLSLTSGSVQGTIQSRDEDIANLQSDLATLAGTIVTQVNNIHRTGYSLNGETGADFFTGSTAGDIQVSADLTQDPNKIQASGVSGESGNNTVVLALAKLASQPVASLGNLTISQSYGQTVATLGQALSNVNAQSSDQKVVTDMLAQQRNSIGGVSLDEEMTDLVKFQRAYQASARVITTVNTLFDEVLNLKR